MPAYINMAAIGATSFRSDALGALDSVAHPLQPGAYRAEVWRGDVRTGRFALEVADQGDGEQIEVDLCQVSSERLASAAVFRTGPIQDHPVFAVFHCDGGESGLYVIVRDTSGRVVVFDSRKLQAGDYYILTPVRPGTWTMKSGNSGTGELVVQNPKPGKAPRASAAGATIKVDDKGFAPNAAQIIAGDGVAFEIAGKDVAILIALKEKAPAFSGGRRPVGLRIPGHAADSGAARAKSARPPRGA